MVHHRGTVIAVRNRSAKEEGTWPRAREAMKASTQGSSGKLRRRGETLAANRIGDQVYFQIDQANLARFTRIRP